MTYYLESQHLYHSDFFLANCLCLPSLEWKHCQKQNGIFSTKTSLCVLRGEEVTIVLYWPSLNHLYLMEKFIFGGGVHFFYLFIMSLWKAVQLWFGFFCFVLFLRYVSMMYRICVLYWYKAQSKPFLFCLKLWILTNYFYPSLSLHQGRKC